MSNSLIFIPDISGFTNFVTNTEIQHSRHIIAELLERILKSNSIGLKATEIEGDAILFIKLSSIPSFDEIFEQVKKMFIDFHEHLLKYENDRICQCGACKSTSGLSLKFIAHSGPLELLKVGKFSKPHGSDLIVAHRLMKNEIDGDEYVLMTQQLLDEYSAASKGNGWEDWHQVQTVIESMGNYNYRFHKLNFLHKEVNHPLKNHEEFKMDNPVKLSGVIEEDKDRVFDLLSNFDFKSKWLKGVDDFQYNEKIVNRLGATHKCVIGNTILDFVTVKDPSVKEGYAFGERLDNPVKGIKTSTIYYYVKDHEKGSLVDLQVHYQTNSALGYLTSIPFRIIMKRNLLKTFNLVRNFAEEKN